MYRNYKIRAPYFEIGFKCFMWGDRMLQLAKGVDAIAHKYDLDVILTPQYADIRLLAENTRYVHVYAQHMDALRPGRGLGSVLPESVREAGAVGSEFLNHFHERGGVDALVALGYLHHGRDAAVPLRAAEFPREVGVDDTVSRDDVEIHF